jgi:hypothetical protein
MKLLWDFIYYSLAEHLFFYIFFIIFKNGKSLCTDCFILLFLILAMSIANSNYFRFFAYLDIISVDVTFFDDPIGKPKLEKRLQNIAISPYWGLSKNNCKQFLRMIVFEDQQSLLYLSINDHGLWKCKKNGIKVPGLKFLTTTRLLYLSHQLLQWAINESGDSITTFCFDHQTISSSNKSNIRNLIMHSNYYKYHLISR